MNGVFDLERKQQLYPFAQRGRSIKDAAIKKGVGEGVKICLWIACGRWCQKPRKNCRRLLWMVPKAFDQVLGYIRLDRKFSIMHQSKTNYGVGQKPVFVSKSFLKCIRRSKGLRPSTWLHPAGPEVLHHASVRDQLRSCWSKASFCFKKLKCIRRFVFFKLLKVWELQIIN